MLMGRWKIEILWVLAPGTLRFGELRRALPGIMQHVLTAQLRELEADGIIERVVFAEVPPRVEYTMTEAGYALHPVFHATLAWAQQHAPRTAN
jgi:DNA-binding HxlR family transcriptional regulator